MTKYIALNLNEKLATTFNDAAKILKDHSDVNVLRSMEMQDNKGMFLIDTTEMTVNNLRQKLPGWVIEREQQIGF